MTSADALISKCKSVRPTSSIAPSLPDAVLTVRASKGLDTIRSSSSKGLRLHPCWVKHSARRQLCVPGGHITNSLPTPGVRDLNQVAKERWNQPAAPNIFSLAIAGGNLQQGWRVQKPETGCDPGLLERMRSASSAGNSSLMGRSAPPYSTRPGDQRKDRSGFSI